MPQSTEGTETNEDLFEAVNHALENEGELPPDDDSAGDSGAEGDEEGDTGGTDTEGSDDAGSGAEEGEGERSGTEDSEQTDASGKPRERNADGTFKSAEQKEAEAAAAAAKPGEKPGDKPGEAKKLDPVNDPIPKDLKPATQERIRSLISTTKEATTRAETAQQNFDYLVQGVQATGTTPEQYGEMLSFMSLFNSQDPAQQEKALEVAADFVTRLSTLLGKDVPASDALSTHADLKDAVARGQITADYAKEIARTRNQNAFRGELTQGQRAAQESTEAFNREQTQARADLTAFEAQAKLSDPHWAAKKAQLVPVLKPIFAKMAPREWLGAFQQAYKDMPFTAPAAKAKTPGIPANQPMRAGKGNPGGGTGLDKAAGSALDAMNAALGVK